MDIPVKNINLELIKEGMPGITPAIGSYLYENCLVSLDQSGHTSGTEFQVNGLRNEIYHLCWEGQITNQMTRSYTDDIETTEQGAVCISVLMAKRLTDYNVIERSWRGTGIDYWLGYESDPLMQRVARLEVSGIKTESATNTVSGRYEQKARQTELSDDTLLPAYISVVEFSSPKCLFNKR